MYRAAMVLRLLCCVLSMPVAHAWTPTAKCQAAADAYCASDCYSKIKDRPCDGPMYARYSGPDAQQWRCYSPSALIENSTYHSGTCYCSRDTEIRKTLSDCGDPVPEPPASHGSRVFKPGDAGMSCFRIPAIVRTTKGSLIAFAEGRKLWSNSLLSLSCGDSDVHGIAVSRSTDNGRTWSQATFAAGGADTLHPVGNPYPIALNDGRVGLVFVNHTKQTSGVGPDNGIVFSDDDGITFGNSHSIGSGFGPAKGSMPGPGAGIQMRDTKRLLVVSHFGAYVRDYITYSDDGGKSWMTVNATFPEMDEATLADLGGGEVLLNMRHRNEKAKGRGVARSADGGLTWTAITYDAELIGPVCQASLAAVGSSVYFSNPASTSGRNHLTVRKSDDGGRTWTRSLLIQEGSSAGYSSLVQGAVDSDTGKLGGILYEPTTAGAIDFTTFPLSLQASSSRVSSIVV